MGPAPHRSLVGGRRRALSLVAAAAVCASVVVAHAAPRAARLGLRDAVAPPTPPVAATTPTATQVQRSPERPVPVPPTPHCTETLMHHTFANSYYQPYRGSFTPPAACPGPWPAVVLTLTSTVAGVQFDRMVSVAVGHTLLLRGSTSEPCCTGNAVTWSVQRDVTAEQGALSAPQPVLVQLDNVNDATYTGQYDTTLTVTFYEPDAAHPAPDHPAVVLPVTSSNPVEPTFDLSHSGQTAGTAVTFPPAMTALHAELFADGHGPCEEFWWSDPSGCAGTPDREVAVYLDGQLAGAAAVYPVTFTGADGPGFWEPIPSPRAWNLRPYQVDLTPFVGGLVDGAAHQVTLGVLGATYGPGDYWPVAATLLASTGRAAHTTGALLAATAPAAATLRETTDPSGQGAAYRLSAEHTLSFTGEVRNAGAVVRTTVTEDLTETSTQAGTGLTESWTDTARTTTVHGPHRTEVSDAAQYGATVAQLAHFAFTDDAQRTVVDDGATTDWSSTQASMATSAVGLAYMGAETASAGYSDRSGACYHRSLTSAAGAAVVARDDGACPGAPATGVVG